MGSLGAASRVTYAPSIAVTPENKWISNSGARVLKQSRQGIRLTSDGSGRCQSDQGSKKRGNLVLRDHVYEVQSRVFAMLEILNVLLNGQMSFYSPLR